MTGATSLLLHQMLQVGKRIRSQTVEQSLKEMSLSITLQKLVHNSNNLPQTNVLKRQMTRKARSLVQLFPNNHQQAPSPSPRSQTRHRKVKMRDSRAINKSQVIQDRRLIKVIQGQARDQRLNRICLAQGKSSRIKHPKRTRATTEKSRTVEEIAPTSVLSKFRSANLVQIKLKDNAAVKISVSTTGKEIKTVAEDVEMKRIARVTDKVVEEAIEEVIGRATGKVIGVIGQESVIEGGMKGITEEDKVETSIKAKIGMDAMVTEVDHKGTDHAVKAL